MKILFYSELFKFINSIKSEKAVWVSGTVWLSGTHSSRCSRKSKKFSPRVRSTSFGTVTIVSSVERLQERTYLTLGLNLHMAFQICQLEAGVMATTFPFSDSGSGASDTCCSHCWRPAYFGFICDVEANATILMCHYTIIRTFSMRSP